MTPPTLFGLMAALAVFVLVIVLLQDRREMVTVAMTSERVPAGRHDHRVDGGTGRDPGVGQLQ